MALVVKRTYPLRFAAVNALTVRLPRVTSRPAGHEAVGNGPVFLVLPARDEEATVADVVRRVPVAVAGRPVRGLVVDDGSTDRTAALARAAGAEVVATGDRRGLGAAVRLGLAEAVRRGAAVVAFCDADGEYAPEELARVVAPILAGQADYVVGSRFRGEIGHMLRRRRLGNWVLTAALAWVARQPVTDGQSGYRALSAAAAHEAEIAHDYNYAQVLTLDLLAKGHRYAEVPISYSFRRQGRSFVHLGPYLRRVVPATLGVVRAASAPQSSTTWAAKRRRAADQAASSKPAWSPTASATAHAMASAWWVLSWANRPWRPRVTRPR